MTIQKINKLKNKLKDIEEEEEEEEEEEYTYNKNLNDNGKNIYKMYDEIATIYKYIYNYMDNSVIYLESL